MGSLPSLCRVDSPPDYRRSVRVLLTGSSGLLGTWLRKTAPRDASIVSLVHRRPVDGPCVRADLRDRQQTLDAIRSTAPDVMIHAAYAKDEESIVGATGNVVAACDEVGAFLLHASTDAVFAGDGVPVDETTVPTPVADYGRWKRRAEEIVLALGAHAVARLPLLTSTDPDDHIVSSLRAAAAGAEDPVWFTDEYRQPADCRDVADALWQLVALPADRRDGAWHLPGPERMTRDELARRAAHAAGLSVPIVTTPTPAGTVRPRDLVLTGRRAEAAIGWRPPPIYGASVS